MRLASTLLLAALAGCSDGTPARDGSNRDGLRLGDGVTGLERSTDAKRGLGKVGDPCVRDEDCGEPAGATCFTTIGGGPVPQIIFPHGYCSKECASDAGSVDCGSGGGCASVSMSSSSGGSVTLTMCARSCKKPEDCRLADGYTCKIIFLGIGFCGL